MVICYSLYLENDYWTFTKTNVNNNEIFYI